MDWTAIFLSLRLALLTTVVLLLLAAPIAYWIAFSRSRWRWLVESVVALPLVLPPTVLGFYLLVALGPDSPVGQAYRSITGENLTFTFTGLLIGSVIYSLPFAVQPMAAAFGAVDRRLLEASWSLGVSRRATFFRTILPLSRPGVAAAGVLAFAHTLGEFGIVLMIGGNIPNSTRTASIAVFDHVQAFEFPAAGRTAAFLLVVCFAALATTSFLRRRPVPA